MKFEMNEKLDIFLDGHKIDGVQDAWFEVDFASKTLHLTILPDFCNVSFDVDTAILTIGEERFKVIREVLL